MKIFTQRTDRKGASEHNRQFEMVNKVEKDKNRQEREGDSATSCEQWYWEEREAIVDEQ